MHRNRNTHQQHPSARRHVLRVYIGELFPGSLSEDVFSSQSTKDTRNIGGGGHLVGPCREVAVENEGRSQPQRLPRYWCPGEAYLRQHNSLYR